MSREGKPFIYQKRHTISLLFDVFAVQSEMAIDAPDELVLGYTRTMMGFLLFNPDPRQIGMIGLGGGSLAKFCYRYLPDAAIAVAEIDPGVIALREHFRIPANDARLEVHCIDGADFVRQAESRFDVLMLDGFDRLGLPQQLCSQQFYDDCCRALAPGGILVTNLFGNAPETPVYLDRLCASFKNAVVVADVPDSLNKIAFVRKGEPLKLNPAIFNRPGAEVDWARLVDLDSTVRGVHLAHRAAALSAELRT
ncbi:MAG TPA: fused MFS/spermidine synthase [Burkholderiaceae bacterium]